jgi:hypothetical protein
MKTRTTFIIYLTAILTLAAGSAFGKYSGGTGEPNNPYLISTPVDMNQIGRNFTDWDKCFKLTADINLSAYTGTQFFRIGPDERHTFSGVFDGNGHTISGFTYTAASGDYIGIFGNISTNGRIENISLVDVNVTGRFSVGGLAGYSDGTISNCNSTGLVSGDQYVGGLVGYSYGSISNCNSTGSVSGAYTVGGLVGIGHSISNCHSTGNVTGTVYVGGLVGYSNGSISDCYSTGAVTGGDNPQYLGGLVGGGGNISNCTSTGAVTGGGYSYCLGGLVGENQYGSISNCYSTGAVIGGDTSHNLGGLVGQGNGNISNCNSTGDVTGGNESNYLGGLAGWNYGCNISNCYSTGAVSGGYDSDYVGGLVGYVNYGYVADCYATGGVAGDYDTGGLVGMNDNSDIARCYSSGSVSGYMYVGGLVGWNYEGTTTDSFWDTDTSGQSWSDGGTGKTTAEMQTKSTFTDASWDFFAVWDINEGQTYPFFKSGVGTGTPDDPYRIATKADLLAIAANIKCYGKCFILTADIDMEGQVFTTAIIAPDTDNSDGYFGGTAFTGVFDGNGHKIINFIIDGGSNNFLGLFGQIGYGGSVKNLGIENFAVSGSENVGGLVGYNDYGSINNCYSTGAVSGSYCSVGGLVGGNEGGSISNCHSTCQVSGYQQAGGLVGDNHGSISNCYSTGQVSGEGGGLVGENGYDGSISNCYSTGSVSGSGGSFNVGGLVGYNNGSISNCYSTGLVSGTSGVGGLVGYSGGTISSCYFLDTSGPEDGNGTPLTDEQMKQQASFVGWDFVWETINGTEDIWAVCEDASYPKLAWQFIPGDFDNDKKVDFADFARIGAKWGQIDSTLYCGGTDLDSSGTVDMQDIEIFAANWLAGI